MNCYVHCAAMITPINTNVNAKIDASESRFRLVLDRLYRDQLEIQLNSGLLKTTLECSSAVAA